MYAYELCRKYHEAVNRKDLAATLKLFVPGATAKAPLAGEVDIEEFHDRLFACSGQGVSRLIDVFEGLGTSRNVAMQFHFRHEVDGRTIEVEGLTVFEYDEASRRFRHLKMIYDPSPLLRPAKAHRESVSQLAQTCTSGISPSAYTAT